MNARRPWPRFLDRVIADAEGRIMLRKNFPDRRAQRRVEAEARNVETKPERRRAVRREKH